MLLSAAAIGVLAIGRDLDGFLRTTNSIGIVRALVATVFVFAGLWSSEIAWHRGVETLAGPLPAPSARQVFFISQLGKYLPGAVWPVLAQLDAARRHRMDVTRMGAASLLFLGLHLLTGLLLVVVLVPLATPDLLRTRYAWILVLVPPTVALFIPRVLSGILRKAGRLLNRPTLPAEALGWSAILRPSGWLMLTWLTYGLAATIITAPLAAGVGPLELAAVATGGFALSWIVGLLVLPAPAGVGAREVVLVLALAPVTGLVAATSIAAVLRVIHTLGDLSLAGVAKLAHR